jgi:DNA replication protein DnaC
VDSIPAVLSYWWPEVDDRDGRRRERRIVEARFLRTKRLGEFDPGATPTIMPAVLAALAAGAWIDAGEPVVLLGDSGAGNTHLLIGLGMAGREPAASGSAM